MHKIVELAIKNANEKLAKKQAGERLDNFVKQLKELAKNPHVRNAGMSALWGAGTGAATYAASRALGNTKGKAAAHATAAGLGMAGIDASVRYKDQLKNMFKGLFKDQPGAYQPRPHRAKTQTERVQNVLNQLNGGTKEKPPVKPTPNSPYTMKGMLDKGNKSSINDVSDQVHSEANNLGAGDPNPWNPYNK